MNERILIIGDGAMGQTCAILLVENDHRVRLWSPFPDDARALIETRRNKRSLEAPLPGAVEVVADEECFEGVSLVVSAVAAQHVRDAWVRLGPHCPEGLCVCSVTKGIECKTLLRPSQMIRDVLGRPQPVVALSGPSIAPELLRHRPATVTAASEDLPLARRVQEAFSSDTLRVYTNPDLPGVELAGATKNVIAIAAGIVDGMGLGDNAKAALVTRGLAEIARLGEALGAHPQTFSGLSGVGDLITTCISPVGRNRTFGEAIGRGARVDEAREKVGAVVEGLATTESVVALAGREGVEMPITRAIYRVLFEGESPSEAIADLMSRPLKAEKPQEK